MRLIVNGDDFGASEANNLAIIRAHDEGILTSCSLMVAEDGFEQAVELARARPRLGVGLHLVTVLGKSVLAPGEIPHIVDKRGYFASSPALAGLKYFFLPAARREIEREIYAQMERFASTGLKFSHVDGHLHMHMHPTIFPILVEAAERYKVRHIRLPREGLKETLRVRPEKRVEKYLLWGVFQLLCKYGEKYLKEKGFVSPGRVYGLLETGQVTEDYLLGLFEQIQDETAEVYCHPEVYTTGTQNLGGQAELEALLSSRVKALLDARSIRLINYSQLGV